jgi:hypothetical protein
MRTYLILITLVLGCGNSTGGGSTATYHDYQASAIKALCQYYSRCGYISKSREADCESQFQPLTVPGYSIDEAITSGRIAYDASAGMACLDAFSMAGCDVFSLLTLDTTSCTKTIQPKVPLGGACKSAVECANSYCQQGTSTTGTPGCAGTCVAYAATGAPCNVAGVHCPPGDTCDSTSHTCVALGQVGAACTATVGCVQGLDCRASGTAMTCQSPGGAGAPCTSGLYECTSGLYCDATAKQCSQRQPAGSACTSSLSCGDGTKCIGASTTQMGTCQPYLDLGQSCAGTTDTACAGDARCDATSHTCVLTGQEGSDCTASCGMNLYCNSMMKCAKKAGVGEACDPASSESCVSGASCDMTTKLCVTPMCT